MIVQTFVAILTLTVALISDVNGASLSNVYVESEVAPIGFYSYGTPYQSLPNPRLSQINSLPAVPGYVSPCVSPCVYPAQTVSTVAPVNPSQNVLTYTAPRAPVIVAPTKQEPTGYEYSYVIYDQNTGDHKAQRELSDGSVVRGQYSFLQPDGYIREVQYVADDVSGFNAVVKNYLPVAEEGRKKSTANENKDSPPCHEIKSEALKEGSDEHSGETAIKPLMKIHGKVHRKQSIEESAENSKEHHVKSKESKEEETSKEKHTKATKKTTYEESGEESEAESNENISKKLKNSKEASGEKSEEDTKAKPYTKPKHSKEESHEKSEKISKKHSSEESEEDSEEENHNKSKESAGKSKENQHKKTHKESKHSEESVEESKSEESKEELKEKPRKKFSKDTEASKNKSKKISKESASEDSGEESDEVDSGKHKEVHELLKPSSETVVQYKDIIRCIEAAMKRNYGVPAAMRQDSSPLTYIVLNKPC